MNFVKGLGLFKGHTYTRVRVENNSFEGLNVTCTISSNSYILGAQPYKEISSCTIFKGMEIETGQKCFVVKHYDAYYKLKVLQEWFNRNKTWPDTNLNIEGDVEKALPEIKHNELLENLNRFLSEEIPLEDINSDYRKLGGGVVAAMIFALPFFMFSAGASFYLDNNRYLIRPTEGEGSFSNLAVSPQKPQKADYVKDYAGFLFLCCLGQYIGECFIPKVFNQLTKSKINLFTSFFCSVATNSYFDLSWNQKMSLVFFSGFLSQQVHRGAFSLGVIESQISDF